MSKYPKLNLSRLTKMQLIALIERIDQHAPRANNTCDEPGIKLSEGAFRMLIDEGNDPLFRRLREE